MINRRSLLEKLLVISGAVAVGTAVVMLALDTKNQAEWVRVATELGASRIENAQCVQDVRIRFTNSGSTDIQPIGFIPFC